MKRPNRTISIFSMSALDVLAMATGALVQLLIGAQAVSQLAALRLDFRRARIRTLLVGGMPFLMLGFVLSVYLHIDVVMLRMLTNEEVVDMVRSRYDHPNQFRFEGRPLLSTFSGGENLGEIATRSAAGRRSAGTVNGTHSGPAASPPLSPAPPPCPMRKFSSSSSRLWPNKAWS